MKNIIKPICLFTGLLCTPTILLHAQVDEKLKADIISTGYVHSPLPLDETKTFETFGLKKKVLESTCCVIWKIFPGGRTKESVKSD
jgi:hypothetical protein